MTKMSGIESHFMDPGIESDRTEGFEPPLIAALPRPMKDNTSSPFSRAAFALNLSVEPLSL